MADKRGWTQDNPWLVVLTVVVGVAALVVATVAVTGDFLRSEASEDRGLRSAPAPASSFPVSSPGSTTTVPDGRVTSQRPATGVFNQFELTIDLGYSYELDLAPGTDPSVARAARWTPGLHDLYRAGKVPADHLSGIQNAQGVYNGIQVAGASATAATCTADAPARDGNVKVAGLALGAKICMRTTRGRGALLEVVELSADRTLLRLRISLAG